MTARLLTGLKTDELAELLGSRARAYGVLRWLWSAEPVPTELPERIADVSHKQWTPARAALALPRWRILERTPSGDGTVKYALDVNGAAIETVLIPANGRTTICVSSQAGCTRSCAFCATAKLGFGRNLTAGEIVLQFLVARAEAPKDAPARNVVFMGMGEPMDNLDEVLRAVEILTQAPAPHLGPGHITVSTSGVLPGMVRFLKESRANLALSLNGSQDSRRSALMPQNDTWPIESLVAPLRRDAIERPKRDHFIEYVMFEGVNDAPEDAERVVKLLAGVNARLNLIPFNASPGDTLRPPPDEAVLAFQDVVHKAGLRCLIRWPRGRDVRGACGQLALAVRDRAALPEQKMKRGRART